MARSISHHKKNKAESNRSVYEQMKQKEKQLQQERNSFLEVLSENLRLPPDVIAGAPVITMLGRSAMVIENHKKIIEYTDSLIRVQTGICMVKIEGAGLKVAYCTGDEMKITGILRVVSYL